MTSTTSLENAIRALYEQLIDHWNKRKPAAYAALFTDDGTVIGFDGSVVDGAGAIESHLRQIFADHMTARYLTIIREIRLLAPDVALLRAVVGMVPPGQSDINPAANAIQSLVAVKRDGGWQIALFHNTPAQFHGRPELAQELTDELRTLL
ncbi:MAG: SgcJ/EcaC family oxidoreductase [Chloroflexi bacterium]|nr:SgcJ/EcaC family oxidoreductase [Chloroflexota bacterium]